MDAGFECLSCGGKVDEKDKGTLFPPSWNSLPDVYVFAYKLLGKLYEVKILVMRDHLILHAMEQGSNDIYTLKIRSCDYVNKVYYRIKSMYRELQLNNLLLQLYHSIIQPLLRGKKQEVASSLSEPAPIRGPSPRSPGTAPSQPGGVPPPFGTGGSDLWPNIPGLPPLGGGWGEGGMIGPHHPGFGPAATNPFPLQGGGPPYPLPPGARFDPYGPPGIHFPDPDRDDFSPPGPPERGRRGGFGGGFDPSNV